MSKTSEEAVDFLFPLTRYTRTDTVTAELTEMSRLPRRQVLTRVQEKSRDRWLARETLVAMVRGFERAGDRAAADRVLAVLTNRLRPALKARARIWRTLSADDADDAEAEAVLVLTRCIRETHSKEAFWECSFTVCFNKRINDVFARVARQRGNALSLSTESRGGAERDRADEIADPHGQRAFEDIETQESIQALNRAIPNFAEYLFFHQSGYTDKEIAVKMKVTDRTLRNRKERARAFLTTPRPRP